MGASTDKHRPRSTACTPFTSTEQLPYKSIERKYSRYTLLWILCGRVARAPDQQLKQELSRGKQYKHLQVLLNLL